jgi:hypothetical protein
VCKEWFARTRPAGTESRPFGGELFWVHSKSSESGFEQAGEPPYEAQGIKRVGSKTEGEKGEGAVAEEEEVESASRQMQDKGVGSKDERKGSWEEKGKENEWAAGMFGKRGTSEATGEAAGKAASGMGEKRKSNDWAKGIFGKEGEGKKREGVDAAALREAWKKDCEKAGESQSSVLDGVLLSEKIRPTNRLKVLLQNTKVEKVLGLEGPVDGNRVLLMSASAYAGRKLKDAKYWVGGMTTTMATLDGVSVRSYKCVGGMRCLKDACGYKKMYGKVNLTGFR